MDDKKGFCPICGYEKERERLLVCRSCYAKFAAEAGDYLADKGKVLSFTAWLMAELPRVLENLEVKFAHKKEGYKSLQEQVKQDARTQIRDFLKGERVSEEIYRNAIDKKKKTLWEQYNGNKLFGQMKGIERQIEVVKEVIKGFQKETQDKPALTLVKVINE